MANNPNIIFTKADKSNAVIALDRSEYIAKMENIFSDTCTILQRNSINKLIEELKKTLKRWIQSKFISDKEYSRLNSSNAILPRAYGLSKIHKNEFPLRIIVSSTGSPLHNLATFLHILRESLPAPLSCCRNSFDLTTNLKTFTFQMALVLSLWM